MKIILLMVSSVDGRITRGNEPPAVWASAEDQEFFFGQIQQHKLIVMGRATWEASRAVIKLVPDKRRIVMTREPEKYQKFVVPEQLEFAEKLPLQLVEECKKLGYSEMLVVGGSQVAGEFLIAGLVNELFLTVEPMIFGLGTPMIAGNLMKDMPLKLIEVKKLNQQGTLLLHYSLYSSH